MLLVLLCPGIHGLVFECDDLGDQVAQGLRDGAAARVLDVIIDLHDRALSDAIPFLPESSKAELTGPANDEYKVEHSRDRWSRSLLPADLDELRTPPRDDEQGAGWLHTDDRFKLWAARVWGTFDETVEFLEVESNDEASHD